jgi:CelD/BcsL family acetyltransferase involved in cellulose biosynthesis
VPQLRAGSKLFTALERTGRGGQLIAGESCSRMAAVALSALPQKIRRNAMYYRNRALRAGALELEVAGGSNWSEVFDILVRLHTERWEEGGQSGVFADDRVARWHREALPVLLHAGILRLFSLRLNGEIIGALYSLIDPPDRPQRTQYLYLPAYSIHHADLRPGTLLTALAVEHAAQEGVEIIDMLRGDEEYKRLWHTERTPTFGFVRYRDRTALPEEIAA